MTVEHPDRFQTPSHRRLLVDYVNETAKLGQLRIFELEIDGVVVGNRLAFAFGVAALSLVLRISILPGRNTAS